MVRRRWAVLVLAAVTVVSTAPPAGAAASTDPHRVVSSDARSTDGSTAGRATGTTPYAAVAAVAVAPAMGTDAIFGGDERVPVNPTTSFPASSTVLLTFTGGRCTGFMISERTVATAGHCVHSGPGGTWRTNVVAYPGHDGTTAPYGSCAATRLFTVSGWIAAPDPRLDYGAVQLNCAIGARTGWRSLAWPAQNPTGACTVTQGYPLDRPGQWTSKDFVRDSTAELAYVQHDATSGQDGSPIVYRTDPDDLCPPPPQIPCPCWPTCPCPPDPVLAILSSGPFGGGPGASNNIGTRITQPAFNNFMSWR